MIQDQKTCQNCKQNFTIEPDDFSFYEKIQVPPPTFCWQCRFQRRCAYRNERKLYHGKSTKSGETIYTLYPPQAGLTLYSQKEWYSDDWDQMATGKEYDFSRHFFNQFFDLLKVSPIFASNCVQNTNSDYCANASYLKNCYLMFQISGAEDSAYGNAVDFSKNCFDNSHLMKSERCYMGFWLTNCYQTHFSSQCTDCHTMWFSKNCRGCSNCIGCVNLTNKNYHIFNQLYSKEEYAQRLANLKLNTWTGLQDFQKQAREFWLKFPNRFMQGLKNEHVTGDYINNSKNVQYGYLVREGRDLKYCQYLQIPKNEDCYDLTMWGEDNSLCYENMGTGLGYKLMFSVECWDARDVYYCHSCFSCKDCFGCVGLRNKQYCILNRQYTREDYEALQAKIRKHMDDIPYIDAQGHVYKFGEFFPIELSPYGFNSDVMNDHFPTQKEDAIAQGYRWTDINLKEYDTDIAAADLPDAIENVGDDIVDKIIACAQCKRAYRLIERELGFLRNEKIPIPRTCVECRHKYRIDQRNKTPLYHRACMKPGCTNEFETSYAPDRPEIVYCERCYQQEVI